MPIVERNPLPRVPLETREALHDWLAENHAEHGGFWLVQWRSVTGRPAIPYDDIVEECLIFGWIDSTVQKFDDERRGLRLTPRKPNSVWSASNKQRLARLEAADDIAPGFPVVTDGCGVNTLWEGRRVREIHVEASLPARAGRPRPDDDAGLPIARGLPVRQRQAGGQQGSSDEA